MPAGSILVADDDTAIRTVLNQALSRAGYEVRLTGNAATLWRWVSQGEGDLVITDVVMPDENAFDLLPRIKKIRPNLPVIVMSAQNTFMTAIRASERGAYEYLPKPFDLKELIAIVGRELIGLARLATIEKLHARAEATLASDDRAEAQAIVRDLLKIAHGNPRLAHARGMLQSHAGDIIDGADMLRLAERELMNPLDQEARRLISLAAQRVSIVTAVSPRAVVDVLFVFAAAVRLIRQLARLYGGRPGALGMIKLTRQVIAHLAITGGLAASDSLIQQVLGHGLAAKLSSRLGEGLLNGLLTARLGLAAIDVTRPLPFTALPRPALSDLATDLLRKREEAEAPDVKG